MPRLLCVGDIHLGRRPSRLPAELAGEGGRLGPAEAWRRTVAAALDREVDAVLLAGDVVEGSDDRFEAFGHLERGVGRLVEAGVPVIGVAGNHDHLALPLLARRISGFRLLGTGGRWGHELLTGRDGGRVRVHGWSFPRPRVHDNPLEGFEPAPADGVADVGLLHCDLGSTQSPYAPVPAAMLGQTRCDAWLLGHVHKADAMDRSPFGYLGSLCGVDAGEPGPHGP